MQHDQQLSSIAGDADFIAGIGVVPVAVLLLCALCGFDPATIALVAGVAIGTAAFMLAWIFGALALRRRFFPTRGVPSK